MNIKQAREALSAMRGDRQLAISTIGRLESRIIDTEGSIMEITATQQLFQSAVKLIYENLSSKLGDIITEGIHLVFPESGYKRFVIDFVDRRGVIEADLLLEDFDGNFYHPVDDVGGGIADFISLLLRITFIILSPYENILIADEPLKFIDREIIGEAAKFVGKICDDFDFQLLMISHIPEMIQEAKVIYRVKKFNGVSTLAKL